MYGMYEASASLVKSMCRRIAIHRMHAYSAAS